jgi:hypothetical protein
MTSDSERNRTRHDFLLEKFFKQPHKYQFKKMGNFVLVCQDGTSGWEVAIYRKEAWAKVESYWAKINNAKQESFI